jgi:zinc transporter, ZIP family
VGRDRADLGTRLARRLPLFQDSSPDTVAFVLAFAAGAILTMLANTIMPEAFEHGGKLVGVVTTLGFAVAFAIHTLD